MAKKVFAILGGFVALVALAYVFTMSAGKPITTDLSVVGNGRPSLVLAYENYSPVGGEALNRLREIRAEFDADLNFVIADLGTAEGAAFANRLQLIDGLAVYITAEGEPKEWTTIPAEQPALRGLLQVLLKSG